MKTKRFHWFAYHAPKSEGKTARRKAEFDASGMIHQMRDAAAFLELSHALFSLGGEYQGPLLNLPDEAYAVIGYRCRAEPEDFAPPAPGEFLVQCTRPPLSDERTKQLLKGADPATGQPRVRMRGQVIARSRTPLEKAVITTLKSQVLGWCSRGRVQLSSDLCRCLELRPACRRYADVKFRTEVNANFDAGWCKQSGVGKSSMDQTAGYLIFLPKLHAPYSDLSALFAWGQSGAETLFWNWTLRREGRVMLQRIFRKPRHVHVLMAEWRKPELHARPSSLQSFQKTSVRWLFHAVRAGKAGAKWKLTQLSPM